MIVAQLPRVTQAIATRASVPVQVPLGPVYMLQLANSYMNLAVPTSLASIAVGVRFMQRQGVPLAAAVTSGTINTLANNIVQGVMLVALLLFSGATLNLDIGTPSASGATHILLSAAPARAHGAVVLLGTQAGAHLGARALQSLVARGPRRLHGAARLEQAR